MECFGLLLLLLLMMMLLLLLLLLLLVVVVMLLLVPLRLKKVQHVRQKFATTLQCHTFNFQPKKHVYHINNKLPFCLQQRNWHFTSRSVGAPTRQPTRHTWMMNNYTTWKGSMAQLPCIGLSWPLTIQPPFWSCAAQLPLRGKDPIHVWGHLTINVPPATWLQECGKVVGEAMVSNVALKRINLAESGIFICLYKWYHVNNGN